MPGDTAMSFDWIFFVIVLPWPLLALWAAFVPRPSLPEARTMEERRRP